MQLAILAAGFSIFTGTLSAQEVEAGTEDRRGFWVRVGAGTGSRGLSCDNCIGVDRQLGFSVSLGAGGTLSPQVTVGANLLVWITSLSPDEGGSVGVFNALMGVAQF